MLCEERSRLLIDYRDATRDYAERVRDFVERINLSLDDLYQARVRCAESWERSEKARISLARHERTHSCDRVDFVHSTPV